MFCKSQHHMLDMYVPEEIYEKRSGKLIGTFITNSSLLSQRQHWQFHNYILENPFYIHTAIIQLVSKLKSELFQHKVAFSLILLSKISALSLKAYQTKLLSTTSRPKIGIPNKNCHFLKHFVLIFPQNLYPMSKLSQHLFWISTKGSKVSLNLQL